jgi:hypothetical protein
MAGFSTGDFFNANGTLPQQEGMRDSLPNDLDGVERVEAIEDAASKPIFQKLYDLAPEDREEVLHQQEDRLRASLQYMTSLYPQWISNFKKYRSIADPLTDDLGNQVSGRANLYIPYPFAIVESEMPRLAGRLPRVHVFPRKDTDKSKVEAIQSLIHYSLDRMEFLRLQQLWLRQFEIYGFSPLFYYWRVEQKEVFERVKDQTGQYGLQKTMKTVFDDFSARVIDVFDSFLQPGIDNPEKSNWFMFREFLSPADLKKKVKDGLLYPEVLEYLKDDKVGNVQRINDTGRIDRDNLVSNSKQLNLTGYYQHAYGRYELMWTLEDKRVIAVLNGKILAACGDNPEPTQQKSFINLNLMPQVNEPIGISSIEALGGLPDKLNCLSNERLDNLSLIMNKVVLANRFSNTDFDNLVFSAGNVIMTDNVESAVKFLDVPDLSDSSAREILSTKEEMQFTMGISDFIVGVKSHARLADTATGVSTIVREANARFALKLATFEAYPLRRLVEAIHTYNMMYMPDEKRIHVLGPKGWTTLNIKLDDILQDCDFVIEPGSSMPLDNLSRRDALMSLLDRLIQLQQIVDLPKVLKEVFASFDFPSPEDFVIQKDQLPEAEDAQLAQAENIAIGQGQDVNLVGDNNIHIQVHSRAIGAMKDPQVAQKLQDHIQAHQQDEQSKVQPALAAGRSGNLLFGGGQNGQQQQGQAAGPQQPPNAGGSAQAPGAGQAPGMGGPGGVS